MTNQTETETEIKFLKAKLQEIQRVVSLAAQGDENLDGIKGILGATNLEELIEAGQFAEDMLTEW